MTLSLNALKAYFFSLSLSTGNKLSSTAKHTHSYADHSAFSYILKFLKTK